MRLIRGRDGWWCIAASGVALVPESLVRNGALTEPGMAEIQRLGILVPLAPRFYSLTVLTSTGCNLGCPYCFQNTDQARPGRFDPPRIPRSVLGSEVIEATVEFARIRLAELGVSRLHVLLFGGEPLLNPLGCQQVLKRCGELGETTGAMISNGVLLHRRHAIQLEAAGLRSMQITFDGPSDVHDRIRTTRGGGPTFDRILANVAAAQEATDIQFNIRVNVTRAALGRIADLVARLAATVDAERCGFGMAPVLDYGRGVTDTVPSDRDSSRRIVEGYALAQAFGFRIARPGPRYCAYCSHERGRHGAVINADGTLYSCWESVGRAGYQVGSVATGYADYPKSKWVTCGNLMRSGSTPHAANAFQDQIDADLLDLIRDRRFDRATR